MCEIQTVYEVHHASQYGFHGETTVWIAATNETESKIVGRKFTHTGGLASGEMVVMKDNVAGWEEKERMLEKIR